MERQRAALLTASLVTASLVTAFVTTAALTVAAAGAQAPPEFVAADTGGLEARSAALILSGQEGGDLEANVLALPLPAEEQPFTVALWVQIPGAPLLTGHGEGDLLTEIYAYALTPENEIAGFLTRAIRLDTATQGAAVRAGGIEFQGHLKLFAGQYSLRVLVLQRSSSRFALKVEDLVVPVWSGNDASALPPLLLQPASLAVRVRAEADSASLFPLRLADGNLVPGPPVIDPQATQALYVAGRSLPAELDLRLRDGGGEERQKLELALAEPVGKNLANLELVRLSLPALEMPQGAYRLEVTTSGGATALASRAVRLRSLEETESSPAPAQLATARRDADAAEVANPGMTRREALYLGALGQLAQGNLAAARSALRQLEDEEMGTGSTSKRRSQLIQSEINVAIRLALKNPETLVPLIAFHEELYRRYHKAGDFQLSTHSRNLLALLNQLYLEHHQGAEAPKLVAASMVSLGDYMLEQGSNLSAKKAFERALEHDPNQEAALLGVAGIDENYGLYEDAAEHLRRLVKIQPTHHEARLRLGINLARLEKWDEAEALLQSGIAAGVSEWVTVLSYQELANLCFAREREEEAVELLAEGVERFPHQQRLHLQRAALLDRMGHPMEARKALEQLDPTRGNNIDTPRMLYSQRSQWLAASTRRSLIQESRQNLPVLAEAVSELLGREENALSP